MKSVLCVLMLASAARGAVTLDQVETFTGPHDWTTGGSNPNPPVILLNSGPLGPGDNALRITSNGGSDAGGRLLVYNRSTWAGDYSGQGIFEISASLRNGSANPLLMRLAFHGPGGWFVTPAYPLAAFSGWNTAVFDIKPTALISAGGTNATSTMSAVEEIRILHSSSATFRGAAVSSSFQVDNIRAVPEPSALHPAFLAGLLLLFRKR